MTAWEPVREGLSEAGGLALDFQDTITNQGRRVQDRRKKRRTTQRPVAKRIDPGTRDEQTMDRINEVLGQYGVQFNDPNLRSKADRSDTFANKPHRELWENYDYASPTRRRHKFRGHTYSARGLNEEKAAARRSRAKDAYKGQLIRSGFRGNYRTRQPEEHFQSKIAKGLTEQFLADIFEIKKGLPRYLKNIVHNEPDWLLKYPQYAERIKAHELGRGTGMWDKDFIKIVGHKDAQGRWVPGLGQNARALSRKQPGFDKRPQTKPGGNLIPPSQMSQQARQSWRTQNYPRMNASKQRRRQSYVNWWERNAPAPPATAQPHVNVAQAISTPLTRVDPAVAARAQAIIARNAQPPAQFNAATFRAGPQHNTQLNTVARAHVAANTPAATQHVPAHVPVPAVQQAQTPVAHVPHHPQPAVQPTQAPTVNPQQPIPAARGNERPVRNRWLRNTIGASLGLGTVGAGTAIGVHSYRKQGRNPPRVRRQWEW